MQAPRGKSVHREPAPIMPVAGDQGVSCLMVTCRPAHALLAIEAFRRQTHAERELVIVDDTPGACLSAAVSAMRDPALRVVQPRGKLSIGNLRNLAVEHARGRFICTWDDDDLYDPLRLEWQVGAAVSTQAAACLLVNELMWWPHQQRLAVSGRRPWEHSLLCERAVLPPYPDLKRGSDSPVTRHVIKHYPTALLPWPSLYVHVYHGHNTWGDDHFEQFWAFSEERFVGDAYHAAIDKLGSRLPIADYLRLLGLRPYTSRQQRRAAQRATRQDSWAADLVRRTFDLPTSGAESIIRLG